MPLRLEIKKKLSARSERVKCVDFHPNEPWILAALYSGHIFIWNYVSQSMVKSLEVCDLPVRTARFIPQKQWIVCGADDMQIRVYNYNTMERVKSFEAHTDYIRALCIHPTQPFVLSSSDDMLIKLWDWEKGWECLQVFEGHTHYVMQVEFNPKDTNTFASASLDCKVKVWGLNSPTPHFTLDGHEKGVNCISYYRGGDKPYLASGADDHTIKIWDYQTKNCVATLDGHTNNISSVLFHPQLPIIISGSEDGTVRIWHSRLYTLENTLNYGMERVWTISCLKGSNKVAIGYDDGTIMIKIGHDEPVVSMDATGKVVWANNQEILWAGVKGAPAAADGDRLTLGPRELGVSDLYPQSLVHAPSGRLIAMSGNGQYIIYTSRELRNKSFGDALEFVWGPDGKYATRESTSRIKVHTEKMSTKESTAANEFLFKPTFAAEGIFGGALLGVRSTDFIDFYEWDSRDAPCRFIRRMDVVARKVFWSDNGGMVVIASDDSFYVLRYDKALVARWDQEVGDTGIEGAFELEEQVQEKIRGGCFAGDCFIYTNTAGRLNYYLGGEVITLAHLSKPMYMLGYIQKENRVYLMDKAHGVFSYTLLMQMLVYQAAIVRGDDEAAADALAKLPSDQYNKIARFLESRGLHKQALAVTQDPEHKFELAMVCRELALARSIVMAESGMEGGAESKWKSLGDAALNPPVTAAQDFDLKLAEECYTNAGDLGGLLLIYTSLADAEGIARLAKLAAAQGRNNIAFLCYFMLRRMDSCINLLVGSDRIPEAAFLTRTYAPSRISSILAVWKENLSKVSVKAAEALADPEDYAELFADLDVAQRVQSYLLVNESELLPSILYGDYKDNIARNLIADMKEGRIEAPSDEEIKMARAEAAAANGDAPAEEHEEKEQAPASRPAVAAAAPAPAPAKVAAPAPAVAASSMSSAPAPAAAAVAPVAARAPLSFAAAPAKPTTPAPAASPSPSPVASAAASSSSLQINSAAAPVASASPIGAATPSPLSAKSPVKPATPAAAVTPAAAAARPAVVSPAAAVKPTLAAPVSAAAAAPKPITPKAVTPVASAASPAASAVAAPKPAAVVAPAAAPKPIVPAAAAAAAPVVAAASVMSARKPLTPSAPAAAPAAAAVPSASSIDLDGLEDDDDALSPVASSGAKSGAGVPSLDEINSSLAEIEGEEEDFGDFD